MVSMRCGDKVVPDFEQLVKLPPQRRASPVRSTVPWVDFWRWPAIVAQTADFGGI